jgi:hypothetical protein
VKFFLCVLVSAIISGCGGFLFLANAMGECFPHMPDFQACMVDKRRDALFIVLTSIAVWVGLLAYMLRKRPTD